MKIPPFLLLLLLFTGRSSALESGAVYSPSDFARCIISNSSSSGSAASNLSGLLPDPQSAWTLQWNGALSGPTTDTISGGGSQTVLLSDFDPGTSAVYNGPVSYNGDKFCLYITQDADIYLVAASGYFSTILDSSGIDAWSNFSYSLTMQYSGQSAGGALRITAGSFNIDGQSYSLSGTPASSMDSIGSRALDTLYSRAAAGSQTTVLAAAGLLDEIPQDFLWKISGSTSLQGMQAGDYGDELGNAHVLQNGEGLQFAGGTLSSSNNAILGNSISAASSATTNSFNVAAGSSLSLSDGEGALNQSYGSSEGGGMSLSGGGTLILQNVRSATLKNISLGASSHLQLQTAEGGPESLNIDAAQNSFAAGASLQWENGGTLNFLGAAAGSSLGSLSNNAGSIALQGGNLSASSLQAKSLIVQNSSSSQSVKAESINFSSGSSLATPSALWSEGSLSQASIGASQAVLASIDGCDIQCSGDYTLQGGAINASSISSSSGSLTLQNSSFSADSSLSAARGIIFSSALLPAGFSYSIGGQSARVESPEGFRSLLLDGTADSTNLTLQKLRVDASGMNMNSSHAVYSLLSGTDINFGAGFSYELLLGPAMTGTLGIAPNGDLLLYATRNDSALVAELSDTRNRSNALQRLRQRVLGSGSGGVAEALLNDVENSAQYSLADRRALLSAISGAGLSSLAEAQRRRLHQTLAQIRTHLRPQECRTADCAEGFRTQTSFWFQSDAADNDLSQSGDEAGFRQSSYGGSLGFDTHFRPEWSAGAAFSALFGELRSRSYDHAQGDNDSYYLHAFVRFRRHNWQHTGLLQGGYDKAELRRQVGPYRASGSNRGLSLSALYELGRRFCLGREENGEGEESWLEPCAGISLSFARMGSYREQGNLGNAALCYHSQKHVYGRAELGLRYHAPLAENDSGSILFDAHLLALLDYGARCRSAKISFADGGETFRVYGNKTGRWGGQAGAGISYPLSEQSAVFLNGDAELLGQAFGVRGSLGLHFTF